tara:strand:+ start:2486 stop:2830 length:345 start_codon:yes stop_codon:yes gene_type:complete
MAAKSTTIVLFDDQCHKCTRWADFIQKRDPDSRVNLVGQNSEQGKEILLDIPKEMEGLDSIFLISNDGRWFPKSAAIWRVCRQLAFPWSLASTMFLVPWPIRDYFYDAYARMRK